jgi:hypothetical protein
VTEPIPIKPERPIEKPTDPGEKALKKLEKLEAERGLLLPSDRYKALVNAVKAAQDLIELADKKARFALVIMSVLNAAALLLVMRGGQFIPTEGPVGIAVRAELVIYVVLTVYYISQAIAALRPRGVPTPPAHELPSLVEPEKSMRVLFYADVVARDRGSYSAIWQNIRMDNLTAELSGQLYALSWINNQKFRALSKLYQGLTVMTVMLAVLLLTIGLSRIGA